MNKIIVRSRSGNILDVHESDDVSKWIMEGMMSSRWGRTGEYIIEVKDKEIIENKSNSNKEKRLDLIRDFEALLPHRSDKLKTRIYKWVLANADINVEDI